MATLANKQTIAAPFGNAEEIHRARYTFASDTGAQAAYDVFEANGECLITGFHAVVKTTATGVGATVSAGITGTAAYFVSAAAIGTLTANAVLRSALTEGTPNVEKLPVRLADGDKVTMTIGTADLTAGVIEFVVKVMKA